MLGPLLFLIYINDLPDRVNSQIRLFADDSFVYKTINNTQDSLQLQKDLDALTKWENEWSMEFHPDKCKLLRITNKLKPIEASYYMHNHKLDKVETDKYLRVLLNKKLSWKPHADAICKKANQTRAFLQRNLRELPQGCKIPMLQNLCAPNCGIRLRGLGPGWRRKPTPTIPN